MYTFTNVSQNVAFFNCKCVSFPFQLLWLRGNFWNIERIAFFCMIEKFSKESISDVLGLLPLRGWLCRIADSKREFGKPFEEQAV